MMITLTMAMTTITITTILMLALLVSMMVNKDRENSSPFECGFDPMNSARLPLSSRFFLIAVIFMIFDAEIALLLPMPITMTSSNTSTWMAISCMFLIILIIGLYHKWNQGSLEWSK